MTDLSGIEALRESLKVSPDNIPLRRHLAESLLKLGRHDEAESEYRAALARDPNNNDLKTGLANTYFQAGKDSHALAIVESLVKIRDTPPAAHLLHARLLLRQGEVEFAISEYRCAIEEDGTLRDADFEGRLGIDADAEASEVVEGRVRAGWEGEAESADVPIERPQIDFMSVGGMEDLKEEIRMKIIYPLEHREMFAAYGKAIGRRNSHVWPTRLRQDASRPGDGR